MTEWKQQDAYELVVGLEVHVELKTRTKAFCGCSTAYGAAANTQCCPICMGYPGTLPVLNEEAVHLAALAGMALGCSIASWSRFDRKNYFYPDLPKAYQITQFDYPLCSQGQLTIDTPEGEKSIGITRIHMEEDAGKLIHEGVNTLIDCNRCGVPLIEIVTEPDIRTPQETVDFLRKLRNVLLYAGVSDCRMNEGSLRCDVNLSVHKPGTPFGTRTEMKNLNSFQSVRRAIEAEYCRQVEMLEGGEHIAQETRRFDQATGQTYLMRRKESADDYRFFPEPDLPPLVLSAEKLEAWRQELPILPDQRKLHYMADYGLTEDAAGQIADSKPLADYFQQAVALTQEVKALVSLMTTEVFRLMEAETEYFPLPPEHLAKIAELWAAGDINGGTAKKVLSALWQQDEDPSAYVERQGLWQINDETALTQLAKNAIEQHPDWVNKYYKGKAAMKKALMGAAMGACSGLANPELLQAAMNRELDG